MLCPYCGEKISEDARLCRHCNRQVYYQLVVVSSLEDRQKYGLYKTWQELPKQEFKYLPLSSYEMVKDQLDKIPTTLAWDLTKKQADTLIAKLSGLPLEIRLQTAVPSGFYVQEKSASSHWASFVYGAVAILCLGLGVVLWTQPRAIEDIPQLPAIQISGPTPSERPRTETPRQENSPSTSNPARTFDRKEIEHILDATVFITDGKTLGSGFFITDDGYIASNAHVTSSMQKPIVILRNGQQYQAQKISEDPRIDASIIHIDIRNVAYFELGDANDLYAGQTVLTVGNPGGLAFTITRGIVSYVGRDIKGVPYIQTDAAINKGNSGGPLVTDDLKVVGINSLTSANEQGISFSLPINFLCAPGGLASNFAIRPGSCDPFAEKKEVVQTGLSKSEEQESNVYHEQAQHLKSTLDKELADIESEKLSLQQKIQALKVEAGRDASNATLQERIQRETQNLQTASSRWLRLEAEAKLRYVLQIINLLERQKVDDAYALYVGQIEAQMAQFEASKRELQNFLDRN